MKIALRIYTMAGRKTILTIIAALMFQVASAQFPFIYHGPDSLRINTLVDGMKKAFFLSPDSVVYFAEKIVPIARDNNNDSLLIYALQTGGEGYRGIGQFTRSLQWQLEALELSRKINSRYREAYSFGFLGFTYLLSGYPRRAIDYFIPAFSILDSCKDWIQSSFSAANASLAYTQLGEVDSADQYIVLAQTNWEKIEGFPVRKKALRTLILNRQAVNFEQRQKFADALRLYNTAYQFARKDSIMINISVGQANLARIYFRLGNLDSAKMYALRCLQDAEVSNQIPNLLESARVLDSVYRRQGNNDSALYYLSMAVSLNEKLFGPKPFRELQYLMAEDQEKQSAEKIKLAIAKNRQRILIMTAGLLGLFSVVIILRRSIKTKQKLNQQLEAKNHVLESTMAKLKATQTQLVQSEKMASLGELTAGIAHEIQNPLNFVNNFSDVNQELIEELKEELQKGDIREASAIADNLKENEAKINLHGKRADGIVKSMLQHSRGSAGLKEATDVNKLVDEYIRLAFHGYRAKVKDFNVDLDINLDPLVGSAPMVRQDIGRVILNLLNNAFYAVMEKASKTDTAYKPMVSISTKKDENAVSIVVRDNGSGIPDDKLAKIFQPFFTTKPTGEGTGLGLSLSYDIITKGHGGQLICDTKPNEYTKFTISLPVNAS